MFKTKKKKIWQLAIFIGEKQFWHFLFLQFLFSTLVYYTKKYKKEKPIKFYNNKSE